MSQSTIKLKSSDGIFYRVPIEVAKCSQTIKTMLEELGMDDCSTHIPLPNVSYAIMKKIFKWCSCHRPNAPSPNNKRRSTNRTIAMAIFDADFFEMDHATLIQLILAADYLEVTDLVDIACKKVAEMIKDKTQDEAREMFAGIRKEVDSL